MTAAAVVFEPVQEDVPVWTVVTGDCVEVMASWPEASVDAVVCDPPYDLTTGKKGGTGIASIDLASPYGRSRISTGVGGFMGKAWDSTGVAFDPATWREALRVLKPGGFLLAFGGTRTYHRMVCAIEDAGFEIRDCLAWLYGSGFPKSLDVSKAIDKAAGVERPVTKTIPDRWAGKGAAYNRNGRDVVNGSANVGGSVDVTVPATDAARAWQGWGTALKPAHEPIVLARKPLAERSVAANVLRWRTGAINVDACRIGTADGHGGGSKATSGFVSGYAHDGFAASMQGRWPANVVLSHTPECREVGTRKVKAGVAVRRNIGHSTRGGISYARGARDADMREDVTYADPDGTETIPAWDCHPECPVRLLDEQSGESRSTIGKPRGAAPGVGWGMTATGAEYTDTGGASRFFYVAKASTSERSAGLAERNPHPTVKPIKLMEWLVTLVTPPGGVVLDPFAGSGSTLLAADRLGFAWVGIEQSAEYVEIARQRLENARGCPLDAGPP